MKSVRPLAIVVVCVFEFLVISLGHGQTNPLDRGALLAKADSLQRIGDIREARAVYDKLLWRDPKTIPAMLDTVVVRDTNRILPLIGRAKTYMTEGWWRKAMEDLETALEIDPKNLGVHYLAGICNCELGIPFIKGEPLAFRDKAKAHFEYVIRRDSMYEDVFNQYALVFFQEGNFNRAFELGQLQVELKPEGKKSYTGLFHMYRWYLAEESESAVKEYLSSQRKDIAWYHIGELARRKDRIGEAEKIFREMLSKSTLEIPRQPIQLSLAKILFKKKSDVEAEKLFWRAVEGATNVAELRFVYEDIKYIMSPFEVELFQKIDTNLTEQKSFYRVFWDSRNPNISATSNERMGEHYRRLAYAEENYECFIYRMADKPLSYYSSQSFRAWQELNKAGASSEVIVHDYRTYQIIDEPVIKNYATYALNREYDDRGYIYIRNGEPNTVQKTLAVSGAPKALSQLTSDADELEKKKSGKTEDTFKYIPPNLTWLYKAAGSSDKLIFEFMQISSFHNEWRLGLPFLEPTMLEERVALDPRYDEILRAWDKGKETWVLPKLKIATENTIKDFRTNVSVGLSTERHIPAETIENMDIAASLTTFLSVDDKTLVDVTYGVPLEYLAKKFGDSVRTAKIAITLQVRNRAGKLVWNDADTTKVKLSKDPQGSYVEFARITVPPDSYKVALQIQPVGLKSRGNWNANVRIRDYSKPGLAMSDIQFLLPAQGRGTLEVEGIRVMPSPFDMLTSNQILRTYVQVYGLSMDVARKTSCRIEYEFKRSGEEEGKGVVASVMGIFRSKKKTSLLVGFDRQETESMITQYMPFPMEQFEPGEYAFTVRVTDKRLNRIVERSRSVDISEATQ